MYTNTMHISQIIGLTYLSCLASIHPLFAQQQTANKGNEMQLNADAIKMIQFDFTPPTKEDKYRKLKEAPIDKDFMKFKTDLRMPRSLTDTTRVNKPDGYVRAEPFTIWTRFGEDPIYDVLPYTIKKWEIHWTLNPFSNQKGEYGRNLRPSSGNAYDEASSMSGAGVAVNFDADKLLYESLTKRGRAIRRNRKLAQAWKTYAAYQPTKEDSLKFPSFYRNHPSKTISQEAPTRSTGDSIPNEKNEPKKQSRVETTKTAASSVPASDFSRYIQEQKRQDSLRRQEFFRKDKSQQNAYDIQHQIRTLKERYD